MTRRAQIVTMTPRIWLSCGHSQSLIGLDTSQMSRRADGWYSAVKCLRCERKRSVVRTHLGSESLGNESLMKDA